MENMTSQLEALNADNLNNILPWGRKLAVSFVQGNGLYKIVYEDKQPGPIPEQYSGYYTKVEYAVADIVNFVKAAWAQQPVSTPGGSEVAPEVLQIKRKYNRKSKVEVAA